MPVLKPRTARIDRQTAETEIALVLALDGTGNGSIATGIGFLDHLLTTVVLHARFDLELRCRGDLHVDDHHSVEDCALALGTAIDRALGDRAGIARFGSALVPMDEALAQVAIDLSGRPFARVALGLRRDRIGDIAGENVAHFCASLASAARLTLDMRVLAGDNDHHRAESAFKALAIAMRSAVARDGTAVVSSTKGRLT